MSEETNQLDYGADLEKLFHPEVVSFNDTIANMWKIKLPVEFGDDYESTTVMWYHINRLLRSEGVKGDVIELLCCGRGGCEMYGQELINSVAASKAIVTTTVTADCYSMHTVFALSQADMINIEDNAQFHFHESQMSIDGSVSLIRSYLDAAEETDEFMMARYINPYLTKKEIMRINMGGDVFVNGVEMRKRIEAVHPEESE